MHVLSFGYKQDSGTFFRDTSNEAAIPAVAPAIAFRYSSWIFGRDASFNFCIRKQLLRKALVCGTHSRRLPSQGFQLVKSPFKRHSKSRCDESLVSRPLRRPNQGLCLWTALRKDISNLLIKVEATSLEMRIKKLFSSSRESDAREYRSTPRLRLSPIRRQTAPIKKKGKKGQSFLRRDIGTLLWQTHLPPHQHSTENLPARAAVGLECSASGTGLLEIVFSDRKGVKKTNRSGKFEVAEK
jgi:hypothetical protein